MAAPALIEKTPAKDRAPFRLKRRPEERIQLLSGTMDLVRSEEVFHFVSSVIEGQSRAIVANHNLHSLYLIQKNDALKAFFASAALIEVDSVPLIWWARLVGRPGRRFHRCTYLDWRDQFWATAVAAGWRVFFVGGEPGVAELARGAILRDWPQAQLGVHHGYFDRSEGSAENEAVLAELSAFAPDIVLVGMGMPTQELWIHANFERLPTCALFTVGGAFDYEAGVQLAAPRWMGQAGLEWLFRLVVDPRRLFFRYFVEPWWLLAPAMVDLNAAIVHRFNAMRSGRSDASRANSNRPFEAGRRG